MDDFSKAFHDADSLFVLDIYAASEQPIGGVTSEVLTQRIQELGGQPARYVSSFGAAVEGVTNLAEEGDMILTLGAGSVYHLCPMLLEKLQTRQPLTHEG